MNYSQQSNQTNQTGQSRNMLRRAVVALGVAVVNLGILSGWGMVGNLGGFDFGLPSVAVCLGESDGLDLYEPFVLVDVGDLIEEKIAPYAVDVGECMDINDLGYAVGWFDRVGSSDDEAFLLDPTNGGSVDVLPLTDSTGSVTFESARAIAISNPSTGLLTDSIIVGWAEDDQSGLHGHEAVYWQWDAANLKWQINLVFGLRKVSEGQAVSLNGYVSGFFIIGSSNEQRIFVFDPSSLTIDKPAAATEAASYAMRDPSGGSDLYTTSGVFVDKTQSIFHDHAFYLHRDPDNGDTSIDLHTVLPLFQDPDVSYSDSGIVAMNSSDDLVGFAAGVASPLQFSNAVYWYPSGNSWQAIALQTANPDPVGSAVSAVTERSVINGDNFIDIVGDYATDVRKGVFYVVFDQNTGLYYSYMLDAVPNDPNRHSLVLYPLAVREGGMPPSTWTANGINNRSAIAGSYKRDKTIMGNTGFRPALYVPNDVDNDGMPDIRQILGEKLTNPTNDLDKNGNWLLDWAENDARAQYHGVIHNFRVGLHAPRGDNNRAEDKINGTHAFRMIIRDTPLPLNGNPPSFTEANLSVPNILICSQGTGSQCQDFWTVLDRWGYSDKHEVIITVRSMRGGGHKKHDMIPVGAEQTTRLRNMRIFSYRYARMIDYLQFGNEVLGGTGHVFIQPNSNSQIINGGLINEVVPGSTDYLPGSEYEASINFMLDWYTDQMEAARIGSALAGRPMRVVGPALQAHRTVAAWNAQEGAQEYDAVGNTDKATAQNNRARYLLEQTAQRDNDDRAIFDQHMYYLKPDDVSTVIFDLLDLKSWPTPKARTVYEWGPQVDKQDGSWWTDTANAPPPIGEMYPQIVRYFITQEDPDKPWELFVGDWLNQQMQGPNADLATVMNDLDGGGFLHACYFPAVQEARNDMDLNNPSIWWVPCLDPASVIQDNLRINYPGNWSPLKDEFQDAAASHPVTPFDPHPNPVLLDDACPSCGR